MWVAALGGLVASGLGGLRWLRVAQREHYLPGALGRFAWRWWLGGAAGWRGRAPAAVAVASVVASAYLPAVGLVAAVVVALGPPGLGLRGRTSKLVWTPRLVRLATVWAVLALCALGGSALLGASLGGGAAALGVFVLGVPLVGDVACALSARVERRLVGPFVRSAAERLASVAPAVVGITGSYGKTGTKGYVAHLLGGSRTVLASPASFNNRTGLARALNEGLAPGTEVFVAEMGTYGPGEIAEMCSWVKPAVAVICAIGPVHLERMRTEEAILAAKAEILVGGAVAVLNVDDPRLRELAAGMEAQGRRVWRCSALDPGAEVYVGPSGVAFRGAPIGVAPAAAPPTNVACAVAVALELGVCAEEVGRRLPDLPVAPNRLTSRVAEGGFAILDDTYNSNPAGAAMALGALAERAHGAGRAVLVTPGMVELGAIQARENQALAALARTVVSDMVVVGRTNRRALLAGAAGPGAGSAGASGPQVVLVDTRDQAVEWVKSHLGPGDVVLYENDLPDHYP